MKLNLKKINFNANTFPRNTKDLFTKIFNLVCLKQDDVTYNQEIIIKNNYIDKTQTICSHYIPFYEKISVSGNMSLQEKAFALKSVLLMKMQSQIIYKIHNLQNENNHNKSAINKTIIKDHSKINLINDDYIDSFIHKLLKQSEILNNPRINNIQPIFITDIYSFNKLKNNDELSQINDDSVILSINSSIKDKLIILFNFDYQKDDNSIVKVMFGTIPYYDFYVNNNTSIYPKYNIIVNIPVIGQIDLKDKIIVN